ncbi:MAG TPA: adenosine deaminase [Thermoflexia bacterium]|jgi:adenosine deaminase|nr:adenosine deaminase [Thermoflexia bacterium]
MDVLGRVAAAEGRRALRDLLQRLPKVDLHRHLEGSLRLQTLVEIAKEHGIDLPARSSEELRPYVQFSGEEPDFHRFLAKFRLLREFYRSKEAVERIAYEAVADAAADNVRYLELRFNPVALARNQGFSLIDVTEWVTEAVARAQRDYDIWVRLILQVNRDEDFRTAEEIIEVGLAFRDRGVVGVDLAGDEVNYPARNLAPLYRRARAEGLGVTIHAGEAGPPRNIRDAVRDFHAMRIGHGIRVVEDSSVVRLVRESGVTLEVCPTSNLQTGVVRSLSQHPLFDLLALGIRVTINTDDPSVSDTTLTDEYMVSVRVMGLGLVQIRQAIHCAIEAAFLPDDEKARLRERFREWDRIG